MFRIGLGVGRPLPSFGAFDSDAQAFFDRVTTAGGSLSATEQTAVNTLVVQMKADGIWSKMKAVYPMVGASAAACAQNLKSSSFTGTFNGGWTFASTGVTPNGTNGYMDTGLVPRTALQVNSVSLNFYSRSNIQGNIQLGANTSDYLIQQMYSSTEMYSQLNTIGADFITAPVTQWQGLFTTSRTSSTAVSAYKNGSSIATASKTATNTPDLNFYIGARNNNAAASNFDTKECALASIGDGLTDTEASDFYTAVQAFQTTLSRQV